MNSNVRGVLLALFAGLMFGLSSIFVKLITGFTPIAITVIRFFVSFLIIGVAIFASGLWEEVKKARTHLWMFVSAGLILGFASVIAMYSLQRTLASHSTALMNSTPLFLLFLAPVLLHEQMRRRSFIGVILTICGAFFIGFTDFQFNPHLFFGDMLAVSVAFLMSLYSLFVRAERTTFPYYVMLFWVFGFASLATFIGGFFLNDPFILHVDIASIQYLALFSLFGTTFAYAALNASFYYIRVAKAAALTLVAPLVAIPLGYFFLAELPAPSSFVGILVLLVGVYLLIPHHHPAAIALHAHPSHQAKHRFVEWLKCFFSSS